MTDDENIYWPYAQTPEEMLAEKDAEIERLRANCRDFGMNAVDDYVEVERLQHLLDEFKKRLSERTKEAMRLHKIIAEAPHDDRCPASIYADFTKMDGCNCWKSNISE